MSGLLDSINRKTAGEDGDSTAEIMTMGDQMQALKLMLDGGGGGANALQTKVVDVLIDPENIQYTAMLSEGQLAEIKDLCILNEFFFADSPLINALVSLEMNTSVSKDGYGRKMFGKIAQMMMTDLEQIKKNKGDI